MIHELKNEYHSTENARLRLADHEDFQSHGTVDERIIQAAALVLLKISDAAETFMDAEAQA